MEREYMCRHARGEIFQNIVEVILIGLSGCKNISNDFIIYGKTQKKHNDNFCGVQQHDVRLRKENCAFSRSEIKFYGQITDMRKPESVCKVKYLLGWLSTRPVTSQITLRLLLNYYC